MKPKIRLFSSKFYKLIMITVVVVIDMMILQILSHGQIFFLLFKNFNSYMISVIIIFSIFLLLYSIFGSIKWALIIQTTFIFIFSIFDNVVYKNRGSVMLPEDISGIRTLGNIIENYSFPLDKNICVCIGLWLFSLIISFYISDIYKNRFYYRVASIFLFFLFYSQFMSGNIPYSHPNIWNQKESYDKNGSLINFWGNLKWEKTRKPKGYSKEKVCELMKSIPSDNKNDYSLKPDIILILGESWSELSENIGENSKIIPFLDSFNDTDYTRKSGLITNTIGGGTSLSEYQVLSGMSPNYSLHPAPLKKYCHSKLPTLVSNLKSLDYQASAIHLAEASNWDRDIAYPEMGFDDFISKDTKEGEKLEKVRNYISDEEMYNEIIKILDTQRDQPQFIHAITMQTHGGYTDSSYNGNSEIYNENNYPKLSQYSSLMNQTDKMFETFIKKLSDRERPTIVLAFGDHIPRVEEKIHEMLNKFDYFSQYKTFYTVWSNFKLGVPINEQIPEISINYLGALLSKYANLPLTGFQKYQLETLGEYPIINGKYSKNSNGKVEEINERNIYYKNQSYLQYYYLNDLKKDKKNFFVYE